jgi:aspartate/methionine/tyrosine aminotransferase
VQIAGGVPRIFALDRKNGFHLDPAALEAVIGPRTRVVIINTPHNPTGRVFTADELESVAALARAHGLWVISDESFDKFVFDGHHHVGMASLDGMVERTVVLQSFSKAYGFIGGRVGYMTGPAAIAGQVARFNEQVLSCVSPFMQSVALAALGEEPSWTATLRRQYKVKRDFAVEAVRGLRGFECDVPEGTFYVFADISSSGQSAEDFAMRLLDETRVAVTPGTAFGPSGKGYVRFNLAASMDIIRDGFERLEKAYG